MRHLFPAAAAALLLATPAAAHERGAVINNFYGPTTNYFGAAPGTAAPAYPGYGGGYYDRSAYDNYQGDGYRGGYVGYPPAYYGGYGEYDGSYDGARLDPWNGYSPTF
jgi:hypothetical protein